MPVLGKKHLAGLEERVRSKHTVLLLHATWCIHCQMFASQWDELERRFARHKNVQLLSMESTVIQQTHDMDPKLLAFLAKTPSSPDIYFPKIMVFIKGKKTTRRYEYTGDRNADDVEKFILSKIA